MAKHLNRRWLKRKILAEARKVFEENRHFFGCRYAVLEEGKMTYVHLDRDYGMFSELNHLLKQLDDAQ